ncbi:MAG: Methyltransferase YaeB [Clostridia bacterium 41_269]|nr:MAG: Methyltransferase YaeB [Clostridia bacterium 41_269]
MEIYPIGVIHSPYKRKEDAPRQGRHRADVEFVLEIFPEFAEGLKDVECASHLIVLYWCHLVDRDRLIAYPPGSEEPRGVFACRSPARPNPIAFCTAKLLRREGNNLYVSGLDALDGSYIVDIKPYVSEIDAIDNTELTWFKGRNKADAT